MKLPPRKRGTLQVEAETSPLTQHLLLAEPRFVRIEEVYGLPLLIAAVIALGAANSPWGPALGEFWETQAALQIGDWQLSKSLHDWVNDGLLTLFFFVIGIEIKRELMHGQLASWRQAALPVWAAAGGIMVPASVYLAVNVYGGGEPRGWGTVVATDIAFALAALSLLQDERLATLRVLVLGFATVDNIGGVLVIALVYSQGIDLRSLGLAAALLLAMVAALRLRLPSHVMYVLAGIGVWLLLERSGVHAALAGVALGALVPTGARTSTERFARSVRPAVEELQRAHGKLGAEPRVRAADEELEEAHERRQAELGRIDELASSTQEPAERITLLLNPWVSYAVLPLFALANAGVVLSASTLKAAATDPVSLGVLAGLLVGKPLGFLSFSAIAVRLGFARLPEDVTWTLMIGAGLLAGVGFTVSLFLAGLAFETGDALERARIGVLGASLVSGVLGYLWLWRICRRS